MGFRWSAALVTIAAAGAALVQGGCEVAGVTTCMYGIPYESGPQLPVLGLGLATQHYVASAVPNGPHVTVHNDTDVPLIVRCWIGRVDYRAPDGVTDWRIHADPVQVQPGDSARIQAGCPNWPTINTDSVVRVQLTEVPSGETYWVTKDAVLPHAGAGASAPPPREWWFEMESPRAPYILRASAPVESSADPVFTSEGTGGMTPLPPEMWFAGHNGSHPVPRRG